MLQIYKFYLSSFLKNQTYFAPVFIIFLQFYNLSYFEIFLIFTLANVFKFILEIPTWIFADMYWKKYSIQISKFLIFISFLIFWLAEFFISYFWFWEFLGFSFAFFVFLFAQLLYEFWNSFRSWSETAFVYDYLEQNPHLPRYTEVKWKQKFYARIWEAIATFLGWFIASYIWFAWVFLLAAIPAFISFLISLTWDNIQEDLQKITVKSSFLKWKDSLYYVFQNKYLTKIMLNIIIFTWVVYAISKFIQPYMDSSWISIEYFWIFYSISLIIAAIAVRYSYLVENKFWAVPAINFLWISSFFIVFLLSFNLFAIVWIFLLFYIIIAENIRSPITTTVFQENLSANQRSTIGSSLELWKAAANIAIMPVIWFVADFWDIYTAFLLLSILLLFNFIFLRLKSS